jgi:hypothetical protein
VESKPSEDSWAAGGHPIALVDRWTLGLAELSQGGEDTHPPLCELQLHQRAIWATPGGENTSGASVPCKQELGSPWPGPTALLPRRAQSLKRRHVALGLWCPHQMLGS